MDDFGSQSPLNNEPPLHIVLYYCGAMIFVLGLAISVLVYVFIEDDTIDLAA